MNRLNRTITYRGIGRTLSLALLLMPALKATTAETLADVLRKAIPHAAAPPANTQLPITSYAVLDDSSYFGIAYYVVDPRDPEALEPPLRILLLNKRSGMWAHREFHSIQTRMGGFDSDCLGSVMSLRHSAKWLLLVTNLTPSAECTAVLTIHLKLVHTLYGWPEAQSDSGAIIFQRSEIHFAATHPLELALYKPASGTETSLLPRNDDKIWKDLVEDIGVTADQDWCRENNASCDPQKMSGSLESIAVNDDTHAAALRVLYDASGYGPKTEDFVGDAVVIYIFDFAHGQPRHREFRQDILQQKIGVVDLNKLIEPAGLRLLFSERN